MKTFFALTRIPKSQIKGTTKLDTDHKQTLIPMEQPEYETEAEVTKAIASGTFHGNSAEAYRLAREWQAYQKKLNPSHFFNKAKATNRNGKYNHVMAF